MLVYKVLRAAEWAELQAAAESYGSPDDRTDGFVHLSTAGQLPETLARHFAEASDLRLLALDAGAIGPELAWEPSRGGALFPHLYRALSLRDVLWSRPLEDGPDGPAAPADLT